ncbi:ribosome-associated translation inhibitor RaiA [Mycetocola spongiae]|nr:ribosome-associated translation inhibitor RaiA [Mycetocola spongiae]
MREALRVLGRGNLRVVGIVTLARAGDPRAPPEPSAGPLPKVSNDIHGERDYGGVKGVKGPPGTTGGTSQQEVSVETNIVGFGLGITDRFRDYAEEKSEKVAHLADRAISFEVKVSRHAEKSGKRGGEDRVELTLIGPGPLIRAEASGSDKYVALDLAMAKLMERVRRSNDRRKVLRGKKRTSLHEASAQGFASKAIEPADAELIQAVATGAVPIDGVVEEDEVYSPVVIREKLFPAEWMTTEEAVDRMELVGHDFFLFIDARTDRSSVVYRRKGWDYGVIGLDEEAEEASA